MESLSKPDLSGIVRFANAVSAISATRTGAMAALPRRDEVENFLRQKLQNREDA